MIKEDIIDTIYLTSCYNIRTFDMVSAFYTNEGNLYTYYKKIIEEIRYVFNYPESVFFENLTINYIFSNYGKEIISNEINESLKYQQSKNTNNFDYDKFFKIFDFIKKEDITYVFSTEIKDCEAGNRILIKIKETGNRPIKISKSYLNILNIKYAPVHSFLNPGNQLTTFTDKLVFSKDKNGNPLYNVEIFGSAFNTRLPYYGCMFPEVEAEAGGIGTAEQIFDSIIETGCLSPKFLPHLTSHFSKDKMRGGIKVFGLLVSPPSSIYLHDLAVGKIKIIMEKIKEGTLNPINIVLAISLTKESFIIKNDMHLYEKKKRVIIKNAFRFKTTAIDYELEPHYFKDASKYWCEYYF